MKFQELVDFARDRDGLDTDDVLAALRPLFGQVAACHERGLVAPLRGPDALVVDEQLRVHFDPSLATPPERASHAVEAIERSAPRALEVVGRSETTEDLLAGEAEARSLDVVAPGDPVDRPVFVPGWVTWEHLVGHHDELTDIASLGELLVALAGGLDLANVADVERLAAARGNVFTLAPRLHPVVAQTAAKMLDPQRHRRLQDLPSIIERLEAYRDQPLDLDLPRLAGAAPVADRRRLILGTLRDRLFDLSRRNRLLYFRPTAQSLNLTESSVPLLLDARNIRPEQLFTWSDETSRRVLSGRPISVGSVVRWEDAPYAAATLDTLISQARRDRSEFGLAQLRLVVAFLRWHDLKGEIGERISSPLLLLPVELTKKRGVRDSYVLEASGTEAEVNPALRQHLRQLYALELPAVVDLARTSVAEFHARLAAEIARSEPAVVLTLQTKPRIELIHRRALIRLEAFQRRAGRGSVTLGRRAYAYSYRRHDYRPLGLQIFRDRVAHRPAPLGVVLGDAPTPRMDAFAPSVVRREQETFHIDSSGAGNPYAWDVDLCAVTLANFNYRTMSLVRDYGELLETSRPSAAFERVFSLDPRPLDRSADRTLALQQRHLVVAADGSQVAAIARARSGESFVVQGPPGTGKSQTITNLIADYVARGKRVLFVCQKRAAIDIVHSRLRQRGLDELCCLIHDSQSDKKAFVQGLRATYEAWLADGSATVLHEAEVSRARLLFGIGNALDALERYEAAMGAAPEGAPRLREIVERLVDLREQRWGGDLPPDLRRRLPAIDAWWAARDVVVRLAALHESTGRSPVLASSPVRHVCRRVLELPRPEAEIAYAGPTLARQVRALADRLSALGADRTAVVGPLPTVTLAKAAGLADLGVFAAPLARHRVTRVLDRSSLDAEALRRNVQSWGRLWAAERIAWQQAAGWREPLEPDDTDASLAVARAAETSRLRFLNGSWRRVSAAVHARFAFPQRTVPMTVTEALERLAAAHRARAELSAAAQSALENWGYDDPEALLGQVEEYASAADPAVAAWRDLLASTPDPSVAEGLAALGPEVARLRNELAAFLDDVDDLPLEDVAALLDALAEPSCAPLLRAAAPLLVELAGHHAVAEAARRLPGTADQIEYAVLAAALDDAGSRSVELARFDGARLAALVDEVQALLPQLYAANAAVIVGRVRQEFARLVAHSERTASGMTPDERQLKKLWTTGRRELENEFRKVMRYRSIRELASDEPGAVVAALRPIWLMSPTSVSDTLPLDPSRFDVVIYDEASQIPVEEAVPAMHRSNQVIVVGDQMQLPPTQFFLARPAAEDEEDEDGEVGVVLDADSFLGQSAGRLASTMLTWHYRSRFEALIAFSNAAFYGGRLATIPDRTPPPEPRPPVVMDVRELASIDAAMASAAVDALLDRPISFHRLEGSIYERRSNVAEATYIAGLVRELLSRETGLTVGIVAFSEAQQSEIERALERLADADEAFGRRYEAELAREEDGQLVGLFVKNLENVQGDERDVIVMSVCYGPDVDGRVLMNFGPINQDGGEKRLNVIFSRSRVHMAIVSSIDAETITNTFNDGANTLRRFLHYAALASRGDDRAETVLAGLGQAERGRRTEIRSAVGDQLAAALRARGLEVAARVGQSAFRADLAVRRAGDRDYRLAVLVDEVARVEAEPAIERLLSHPAAFAAAGWRVAHVLVKDWFENPDAVVDFVVRALEPPDPPAEPDPPDPPDPTDPPDPPESADAPPEASPDPTPELDPGDAAPADSAATATGGVFTVYWTSDRFDSVRRARLAGRPLHVLVGGPHTSGKSLRLHGVRPGDTVIPISVRNGALHVLGSMRIDRIEDPDAFLAALPGAPGASKADPFEGYRAMARHVAASSELTALAPYEVDEFAYGTGTPLRLDVVAPVGVVRRLRWQRSNGAQRAIGHLDEAGRITRTITLDGVYRLTSESAADLLGILGVGGSPVPDRATATSLPTTMRSAEPAWLEVKPLWSVPIGRYFARATIDPDLGLFAQGERLQRLDLETGRELATFRSRLAVRSFALDREHGDVYVAGNLRVLHLDGKELVERDRVEDGIGDGADEIVFHRGHAVACWAYGTTALIVDLAARTVRRKRKREFAFPVAGGGRLLIVGGKEGDAFAVDVADGSTERVLATPPAVAAAISPDGSALWLVPGDRSKFNKEGEHGEATDELRVFRLDASGASVTLRLPRPVRRVVVGKATVWAASDTELLSMPVDDPLADVAIWRPPEGHAIVAFDPDSGYVVTRRGRPFVDTRIVLNGFRVVPQS